MWKALDGLNPLLESQEAFNALATSAFRRFGRRVVDLSYANPHDGPPEDVRRALRAALDEDRDLGLQYAPYGGRRSTRRLIAAELRRTCGLPFGFRDVVMTPGAMAALNVAIRALFGPEDEVLVPVPCWHDYPLYLRNLGVAFRTVESSWDKHLDLAALERRLHRGVRGVLISQPCCPTGVLYSPGELTQLAELLARAERRFGSRVYLISDEVHAQLVWSGEPFHSPLTTYPRTLRIYSFGKALCLQGQRIGYVAVSPLLPEREELQRRLERCVRLMGFCGPTALMQAAVCRLLDHRPSLPDLAGRQQAMRQALGSAGYDVVEADATFFVYARAPLPDDRRFAELLAAEGVLVLPSTLFHEGGYFRVSLTSRWESLVEAFPAFRRVLDRLPANLTCSSRSSA